MMSKTILGLSGSLRRASFNAGLLQAAADEAPEGLKLVIGQIADVPLYNADDEKADGAPPAVLRLRDQLKAADGLLLVTPEYNNGIPGVFKNVIDWMSSGEGAKLFHGKPLALMGASPTAFGTSLGQTHWLQVLRTLRVIPWFEGRMMVAKANDKFDKDGKLVDADTRKDVAEFIKGFADSL